MIKDLKLVADSTTPLECNTEVCIIGAGTAGIFLADQLQKQGIQVIMLEAGGRHAKKPEDLDQICEHKGVRYRGAELGRSFGLGGTSVLWGGQMLPLARSDLMARPACGFHAWPISFEDIEPHYADVRQALGLTSDDSLDTREADLLNKSFPELVEFGDDFRLRLSTWLPFKKRNFANTFSEVLENNDRVDVWLNAVVTEMRTNPTDRARIEQITVQSTNKRSLLVRPQIVVICAGALESTRMLLEFDEATENSITKQGAPLGRYFSDHLSITCGQFEYRNKNRLNRAVAPIFTKGLMRTPRLEVSPKTQADKALTSAFAHFAFITHGDSGFDLVRNVLRRQQGGTVSLDLNRKMLLNAAADIWGLAYWKSIHRRLWIPQKADLLLQVDIEQIPNSESRVTLSDSRDALKRKRLIVDWRVQADDNEIVRTVAELTASSWQKGALQKYAALKLKPLDQSNSFDTLYDVYHPTGTIRMGRTKDVSVVNSDMRLWTTNNCYVSTTAVFPSSGSANPGMTHLALTARLAQHIGKTLPTRSLR